MSTLKPMRWRKEYFISNKLIDSDHIKLFDIYNKLAELTNINYNKSKFSEALSKMTNYSIYHFTKEEAYMKEMGYPDLEHHQKEHLNYVLQVAHFNADFTTKKPPSVSEVMNFLESWWKNHIQIQDKKYEHYKKSNQIEVECQQLTHNTTTI